MLILTVFVNVLLVRYSLIYGANFVTNFIAIIDNDLHIKALLSQLTFLIVKLTVRLKLLFIEYAQCAAHGYKYTMNI